MSLIAATIDAFEGAPLPDTVRKTAISLLVANARRQLGAAGDGADAAFAREMAERPIAEHTDAANAQHYEVPAEFFLNCLGPQLKYSSALYRNPGDTLAQAEEHGLRETAEHADLRDGQRILELGCGWGSLSLWMAKAYPNARITAVSNSASQKAFIMARAQERGLGNLEVITCDMNHFEAPGEFDRVVSVEMFEHMANWRALLTRVKDWLKPDGRLFIHVFTHKTTPYRFDVNDEADWIAKHFFSGGVMPSHGLITQFPDLFALEQDWRWSGSHYEKTALHWLELYDRNIDRIRPVLERVYGADATLWHRRWRLFFLATAGLFGHRGGTEWGVSHYRLRPV
jgi:cyclopropane-fatty-acyl-phospholipid synthase